jgi:cytoskeletal protein CcmA (bactofilin family)
MFNKTNKPRGMDSKLESIPVPPTEMVPVASKKVAPPISSSHRAASVIFSNLTVQGNILGSGDLHLDGTVQGDVKAGHLTVGESGNVEGKVEADTIEVRGRIVGSIIGKHIRLMATAYVEGDITHDQLSIEVGAYFQGRCLQTRNEAAPPAYDTYNSGIGDKVQNHDGLSPMMTKADVKSGPNLGEYDLNSLSDLKPGY